MTNHPIHIQNEDGGLSPTALVPFCEFGDKMYGVDIPKMNFPVCNGFKARIIRDQLCYTLDLNDYKKNLISMIKLKYLFLYSLITMKIGS